KPVIRFDTATRRMKPTSGNPSSPHKSELLKQRDYDEKNSDLGYRWLLSRRVLGSLCSSNVSQSVHFRQSDRSDTRQRNLPNCIWQHAFSHWRENLLGGGCKCGYV